MKQHLVYVAAVLAIVSYVALYLVNPYGTGFLYALLFSVGIATLSPFIGLVIAGKNTISLNKYQVCVAVNIYAAAMSLYMLYSEHAMWRLPVVVLSIVVFLAIALAEKGGGETRVRAVHRRTY